MTHTFSDAKHIQGLIEARIENLRTISAGLPGYIALIEAAAAGERLERSAVLQATGLILDNLYRGVLSPRPSVPRDFWSSPLGLTIARAHTHVVPDSEVISQAEAASALGISREYVSQLVESGKVQTIVRDAAAPRSRKQPREMLYRDGLEAIRRQLRSEKERRTEANGPGPSPAHDPAATR
jgi:hypothetical protein